MKRPHHIGIILLLLPGPLLAQSRSFSILEPSASQSSSAPDSKPAKTSDSQPITFYGFDSNEYPGDDQWTDLRRFFSYTGFWLNVPPGAMTNPWAGKRRAVEEAGLGYLVLFNGRLDKELHKALDAAKVGSADAALATEAGRREGFPSGTVIFLDIEEGGRMLPEQKAYIYAWVDGVTAAGFRAGIYCSGIPASEGHGVTVITADDLRQNAAGREIVFWVANDGCPPSPGCMLNRKSLSPVESGVGFADVWQFAQSPRRPQMTHQCKRTYAPDQNCYEVGGGKKGRLALDMNTAREPDPSHGRDPK